MAKLIKKLPKDALPRVATTRIVLEDVKHTSVIKKGETFYHRFTKRYHYIYDVEGDLFYSYEVDTATADRVLTRSKRAGEDVTQVHTLKLQFSEAADKLHALTTEFIDATLKGSRTAKRLSVEMAATTKELNDLADAIAKSK